MLFAWLYCIIIYVHLFVGKIFRVINFCGLSQPRKYFNRKKFPNYDNVYVETLGVIGPDSLAFLHDLASRIWKDTMEPLALQYLLQRLSVAIQRGNATAICSTAEWDSSEESPCL